MLILTTQVGVPSLLLLLVHGRQVGVYKVPHHPLLVGLSVFTHILGVHVFTGVEHVLHQLLVAKRVSRKVSEGREDGQGAGVRQDFKGLVDAVYVFYEVWVVVVSAEQRFFVYNFTTKCIFLEKKRAQIMQ